MALGREGSEEKKWLIIVTRKKVKKTWHEDQFAVITRLQR